MWIVHPYYAPRKLTRTSATSFSLDAIEFTTGPFLTRNDLIDPTVTLSAYMHYTGTYTVGSAGTLLCCKADGTTAVDCFTSDHVGALFKLIHARTNTISKGSATSVDLVNAVICAAIDVKVHLHFKRRAYGRGH